MLKFFRLYNKYILAVGVAVLMVVFLLQPVMQMFTPSPQKQVIGHVYGQKVRQSELINAATEMQVLQRMSPLIGLTLPRDPAAWMLALRDAEHLGLSASPTEVEDLLRGVDEAVQHQLAASVGADAGYLRQVLRHWLMIETYRQLLLGETYMSPPQRLMGMNQLAQVYGPGIVPLLVNRMGVQRLSTPLVRRFVVDQQATVGGKLVVVSAEKAVKDVPEPSQSELQEMFDQYKDVLPGEGDPAWAGYKIPPRVKIEYLSIPFAAVSQSISVDEVAALAYFENNRELFNDKDGKAQEYTAVRGQVIEAVRNQQAEQKIDQMIRRARALCQEAPQYRQLAETDGYKVIPDGYEPLSLRIVAEKIKEEYSIEPTVMYLNQEWATMDRLMTLPGLGDSSLAERGDVFFVPYLLSCKQMQPENDNPLLGFRLQTHVISRPMRSMDGSRHLFRLSDAQPAHAPAGLDAVREQVVTDVKRLTAYHKLVAESDTWKQQAAEQGLHAIAEQLDEQEIDLPDISRAGSERNEAPRLPGVGANMGFVQAVFKLADELEDQQPIADLSVAQRLLVHPLEDRLSLAVFRLDEYKPITAAEYEQLAQNPQRQGELGFAMLGDEPTDPLDYKVLVKRTGYVSEFGSGEDQDEQKQAEPQQSANAETN
ncbi:MAG: hypothetical protein IT445_08395 [Phycisphaeraceae bacterium]|nr:hypothetical protein [Phycisphaeraceae bacterium]